jgi:hypothetical protein
MGVKVLRKTVGLFSGRGLFKKKIKDFLNLLGGIPVEQINKKSFEMIKVKDEKSYLSKLFNNIRENSKILYLSIKNWSAFRLKNGPLIYQL